MTVAPNSAPPGSYIWDAVKGYTGRINLDGSEDRRFTAGGECSFLNDLTRGARLSNPTATAKSLISKGESNKWVIRGYTLVLGGGQDLTLDQWLSEASDALGGVCGIQEILDGIANDPDTESEAKLESIRKLFRLEVSRRGLSKHPQVVAARKKHDAEVADLALRRDAAEWAKVLKSHVSYPLGVTEEGIKASYTFNNHTEETVRRFLLQMGGDDLMARWDSDEKFTRRRTPIMERGDSETFVGFIFHRYYKPDADWLLAFASRLKSYHLDALEYLLTLDIPLNGGQERRTYLVTAGWVSAVMYTIKTTYEVDQTILHLLGAYKHFKYNRQFIRTDGRSGPRKYRSRHNIDRWSSCDS